MPPVPAPPPPSPTGPTGVTSSTWAEIYSARGGVGQSFLSLLNPNLGESFFSWLLHGGPVTSGINTIANTVPGHLENNTILQFVKDRKELSQVVLVKALKSYQQLEKEMVANGLTTADPALQKTHDAIAILDKYARSPGTPITTPELSQIDYKNIFSTYSVGGIAQTPRLEQTYDFEGHENGIKALNKIEEFYQANKTAAAFADTINTIQTIRSPGQWLSNKIYQSGHFKTYLGFDMSKNLLLYTAKYGAPGTDFIAKLYLKQMASFALKAVAVKSGIYKIHNGKLELEWWYQQKLKVKNFINQKITKPLVSKTGGAVLGKIFSRATPGVGFAATILAPFYKPIKNMVLGFGALVIALASKYGASVFWGAGIGGAGGGISGAILGTKAGAAIGTAMVGPIGTVAGGIVGGVLGFFTGFLVGGSIGTLIGIGWANIFGNTNAASIAGTTATRLGTITSVSIPASTALIAPISLAGAGALTAYTIITTFSAFYVPSELANLVGSKYINAAKVARVAGIDNATHVENSATGEKQKVIYTIGFSASGSDLQEINVRDETTYLKKNADGKITSNTVTSFYDVDGDNFNQPTKTSWQVPSITDGAAWGKSYGFYLTNDYQNSRITNTVTITAKRGGNVETKVAVYVFTVGDAPSVPLAETAKKLVDKLISCYDNGGDVNIHSYTDQGNCLNADFQKSTVNIISGFLGKYNSLQCGEFVMAAMNEAMLPPLPGAQNSKDWFGLNSGSFSWHTGEDFSSIQPGDIFISNKGEFGHSAIVYEVGAGYFILAEANFDLNGLVRYNGPPFMISEAKTDGRIGYIRIKSP